jgi:hypothetical protein
MLGRDLLGRELHVEDSVTYTAAGDSTISAASIY